MSNFTKERLAKLFDKAFMGRHVVGPISPGMPYEFILPEGCDGRRIAEILADIVSQSTIASHESANAIAGEGRKVFISPHLLDNNTFRSLLKDDASLRPIGEAIAATDKRFAIIKKRQARDMPPRERAIFRLFQKVFPTHFGFEAGENEPPGVTLTFKNEIDGAELISLLKEALENAGLSFSGEELSAGPQLNQITIHMALVEREDIAGILQDKRAMLSTRRYIDQSQRRITGQPAIGGRR